MNDRITKVDYTDTLKYLGIENGKIPSETGASNKSSEIDTNNASGIKTERNTISLLNDELNYIVNRKKEIEDLLSGKLEQEFKNLTEKEAVIRMAIETYEKLSEK